MNTVGTVSDQNDRFRPQRRNHFSRRRSSIYSGAQVAMVCAHGPLPKHSSTVRFSISPSLAPGQVISADLCSKGEVWPIPKADWSSPSGACSGDLRCFGSLKPPRKTCADLGDDRPPGKTLQKTKRRRPTALNEPL